MAASVEDLKGYEHQFVGSPPDDLLCLICHSVARDPQQINCCGKLLCKVCLEDHKRYSRTCPQCRKPINSFADKISKFFILFLKSAWYYFHFIIGQRNILSLTVLCDNSSDRCEWVGKLRYLDNHLASCDYTRLPCPNECHTGKKVVQLCRKDLEKHTKEECPRRQYECPHCQEAGEFKERTTTHLKECPMKEVPCPKRRCNTRLPRRDLPKHRLKCLFEKVPCKFSLIGCNEEVLRKDLKQHEGDSQLHLQLAIEIVNQQQITIRNQDNMLTQLKAREMPIKYKFTDYDHHKTADDTIHSPGFYTSPGGYKMCISVDASGKYGEDKGTYVSVYVYLMKGENDDHLPWPFTGRVTVELLNQLEDRNHYLKTIMFIPDEPSSQRVVKKEKSCSGWGHRRYISHSELGFHPAKNRQYLKNDCLYFRISVDAKRSSTPWLV